MNKFLLLLTFLLVANLTNAQAPTSISDLTAEERNRIEERIRFAMPVDLSDEQVSSMLEYQFSYIKKAREEFVNLTERTKEDRLVLKMDYEDGMLEFLSADQVIQLEEYKVRLEKAQADVAPFMEKNKDGYEAYYKMQSEIRTSESPKLIRKQRMKLDELMQDSDKEELSFIKDEKKRIAQAENILYAKFREETNYPTANKDFKKYSEQLNSAEFQKKMREKMEAFMNRDEQKQLEADRILIDEQHTKLTRKYELQIADLMEETRSQREEWNERLHNVYDELNKAHPIRQINEELFWKNFSGTWNYNKRYEDFAFFKKFILMESLANQNGAQVTTIGNATHELEAFPNPAVTEQTISITLQQDEHVLIELLDQGGAVIKTILNEKRAAGNHKLETHVGDLSKGMFLYRVTSKSGESIFKFMKLEG